jgi:hypothetical protein
MAKLLWEYFAFVQFCCELYDIGVYLCTYALIKYTTLSLPSITPLVIGFLGL